MNCNSRIFGHKAIAHLLIASEGGIQNKNTITSRLIVKYIIKNEKVNCTPSVLSTPFDRGRRAFLLPPGLAGPRPCWPLALLALSLTGSRPCWPPGLPLRIQEERKLLDIIRMGNFEHKIQAFAYQEHPSLCEGVQKLHGFRRIRLIVAYLYQNENEKPMYKNGFVQHPFERDKTKAFASASEGAHFCTHVHKIQKILVFDQGHSIISGPCPINCDNSINERADQQKRRQKSSKFAATIRDETTAQHHNAAHPQSREISTHFFRYDLGSLSAREARTAELA